MWWLIGAALAADCVRQTTSRELGDDLKSATEGLTSGDADRFRDTIARLKQTLECVGDPVSPDDMATYRVLLGVEAFGRSELDESAALFLAGRALSSDLTIPLYPTDHEIYGVFRRYDPVRAERRRLPAPRKGVVMLDGFATRDRYAAAPVFAQYVVDGSVISAHELAPGEVPTYPVRHPVRTGFLVGTGALGATAGGLLLASRTSRSAFFSGEKDFAQLNTLRARTNTLAGTGMAVGSAAVISGVGAILFRDR
ncbi:MAG: hypothetical protein R3F61_34395 [Myxococcota bacterium]